MNKTTFNTHKRNGLFRMVCDLLFERLSFLIFKVQSVPQSLDLDPQTGHDLSINCQLLHKLENIKNYETTCPYTNK